MGLPIAAKQVIAISPAQFTNAATATGQIDTLGYDYLTLDVAMATSNNTTNNPSVLKITEGDTTVISSAAAITALTGDGTGGFTIPASVTSGDWGVKFNLDLRKRKRYLFLSVSPLTTQVITAIANLSHGEESPVNTTEASVKALVEA